MGGMGWLVGDGWRMRMRKLLDTYTTHTHKKPQQQIPVNVEEELMIIKTEFLLSRERRKKKRRKSFVKWLPNSHTRDE